MRWHSIASFFKPVGATSFSVITWSWWSSIFLVPHWIWIARTIRNHLFIDWRMGTAICHVLRWAFIYSFYSCFDMNHLFIYQRKFGISYYQNLQKCNAKIPERLLMGMLKARHRIVPAMSFNSIAIQNIWCKVNRLLHAKTMGDGQVFYRNVSSWILYDKWRAPKWKHQIIFGHRRPSMLLSRYSDCRTYVIG